MQRGSLLHTEHSRLFQAVLLGICTASILLSLGGSEPLQNSQSSPHPPDLPGQATQEKDVSLPFSIIAEIKGTCQPGVSFQVDVRIDSLIAVEDVRLVAMPEPGLLVQGDAEIPLGDLSAHGAVSASLSVLAAQSGTYQLVLRIRRPQGWLHQRTLSINVLAEGGGIDIPSVAAVSGPKRPGRLKTIPKQRPGNTGYTEEDARKAAPRALVSVPVPAQDEGEQISSLGNALQVFDDSEAEELPIDALPPRTGTSSEKAGGLSADESHGAFGPPGNQARIIPR